MRVFVVAVSFAMVTSLAHGQGAYRTAFGLDGLHHGQSALRGPHRTPHVRWRVRARRRVFATPVQTADGRIVFAGIDGTVHALDAEGVERWAWSSGHPLFATAAAVGDTLFVAHDGGALVALDPLGRPRWTHATADDADASPLIARDGSGVFLATRALESIAMDGTVRWRAPLSAHVFGAPALTMEGATVVVGDLAGDLTWVAANDGHIVRQVHIGSALYGGPIVLDDGTTIIGARDGHVRAYAADGTLRWDVPTHDEIHATPALARDGTVIVGSDDGALYGLRPADGSVAFRVATSGRVRASARIDADGYIFVGSEDDMLYGLDPRGSVAWTYNLGADIDDAVLILPDGDLVVGADDGSLSCLTL